MTRRILLLAAALVLAGASAAHAQRVRVHDVPARPRLWAEADTNSAMAYYTYGLQQLERDPGAAAAAFYWASRLEPGWADAMYARRIALLMTDRRRLQNYVDGRAGVERDREVIAIDSLQLRALAREPFLHEKLDRPMLMMYFREKLARALADETGSENRALADHVLHQAIADAGPLFRAWIAYAEGRFPVAAEVFDREAGRGRNGARIRVDAARAHYLAGNHAKAAEHLAAALAERRQREDRDLVRVYESKAMLEHARAQALLRAGDAKAAREAFGAALQEDLAFWASHVGLSEMALQAGDTAAAHAEMALAVEIAPTDASLRYAYGLLLAGTRKIPEAVPELAKAAELEPLYAAPHYLLGLIHDRSGIADEALAHYGAFLERAARGDPRRAEAEARVAALRAAAEDGK